MSCAKRNQLAATVLARAAMPRHELIKTRRRPRRLHEQVETTRKRRHWGGRLEHIVRANNIASSAAAIMLARAAGLSRNQALTTRLARVARVN